MPFVAAPYVRLRIQVVLGLLGNCTRASSESSMADVALSPWSRWAVLPVQLETAASSTLKALLYPQHCPSLSFYTGKQVQNLLRSAGWLRVCLGLTLVKGL